MKNLIILAGPTAVGKTELSIKLAERIGGEIISADSIQVYRRMDIGSAKITRDEMRGIRHHLIDVLNPDEEFNVHIFQSMAKQAMSEIYQAGKIPIIVGGTGFYIQAVLYDVKFDDTDEGHEYRRYLEKLAAEKGNDYLHAMLKEIDTESSQNIHVNNVKRVIRALEYYHDTGGKISEHNSAQRQNKSPYRFAYFVLNDDRKRLYDKINNRVDAMISKGLENEVRTLMSQGISREMVSMQGIGYKEMADYICGEASLEETVRLIKKNTRHFAKRQLTWFRRERDVTMFDRQNFQNDNDILNEMIKILCGLNIIDRRE